MFRSTCTQAIVGRARSNSMLLAIVLGIATLVIGADARAQFIVNGPDGSLGIANANGGYDFFYPDRMNPFANIPIPGSMQNTPAGPIWKGLDGKIHGNLQDPLTGDMHFRMAKPNAQVRGKNPPVSTQRPSQRPVVQQHRAPSAMPRSTSFRPAVPYQRPATTTTVSPAYRSR